MAARTRPSLELRSFTARDDGSVLTFSSAKNTRTELAALIKDDTALEKLEAWPGRGELVIAIEVGGQTDVFAVVRGGSIYIASSEPKATAAALELLPWFSDLIGRPFPLDLPASETKHIVDHFFGSDFLTPADISEAREGPRTLPHVLNAKVDRPYRVLGYWGYGTNSYAFYETIVRDALDVRLRLPFGGVYMDAEEAADSVVSVLVSAERIVARHSPSLGRLELWGNMGAARGTWTPREGAPMSLDDKSLKEALAELAQWLA
ncbi:MAG: hypothetical protein IT381_32345 [Deltaproteobacteria bacterium]|nr:hypothetical protein [Deltaproteobacteria bacterium]